MTNPIKEFSVKFIDIMVGIILGLGLQWWPNLHEPWQYAAFIVSYLYIIDFWIDYGPSLKKFPPKKEIDVLLDVSIVFAMFLFIFTAQLQIWNFLSAYILLMVFDYFWLFSSDREYKPLGHDKLYLETWMRLHVVEVIFATMLILAAKFVLFTAPTVVLIIFIIFIVVVRLWGSFRYRRAYLN